MADTLKLRQLVGSLAGSKASKEDQGWTMPLCHICFLTFLKEKTLKSIQETFRKQLEGNLFTTNPELVKEVFFASNVLSILASVSHATYFYFHCSCLILFEVIGSEQGSLDQGLAQVGRLLDRRRFRLLWHTWSLPH